MAPHFILAIGILAARGGGYMLPLAILAIGIPVGLALTGVLLGAAWLWRTLW
jgi:hypothetical protein